MLGDPTPLPPPVVALIDRYLASMSHVDLLVVFARADGRPCTLADAAAAVHAAGDGAAHAVADLIDAGLLARHDRDGAMLEFVYAPRTAELRDAVAALIELYDQQPVTLVRAIYHRPSSAVRSFADAFRLRPGNE